jgi:ribosomal protein S10
MLVRFRSSIYVHLKSFFFKHLIKDIKQVHLNMWCCSFLFGQIDNIIYLPKRIKKFSVVRSPTMSKLSKEQFEVTIHKVCIMYKYRTSLSQGLLIFFQSFHVKYCYLRAVHLDGL